MDTNTADSTRSAPNRKYPAIRFVVIPEGQVGIQKIKMVAVNATLQRKASQFDCVAIGRAFVVCSEHK
jgi:stage V sporulation protein SpoVS